MHLSEFGGIDFWSLDHFNFSNSDVLDWINGGDLLGDLLLDNLTSEKIEKLGGVGLSNFLLYDIVDSLSDLFLLRSKSIIGLSFLVR